jgi:hypothetical protein
MEKKKQNSRNMMGINPPGYIESSIVIPGDTDVTNALYHARIKAILKDKKTLNAFKNAPDRNEIINKLLEMPESKVPDEEFFAFLAEDPIFLKARFTGEKVWRWQEELYGQNKLKADKAQDNLRKIGTTLALKKLERPQIDHMVFHAYQHAIKTVKGISALRSNANKLLKIREMFSDEAAERLGVIPKTDRGLAIKLTAQFFGLSDSTVETYLKRKNFIKMTLGNTEAVVLKPKY